MASFNLQQALSDNEWRRKLAERICKERSIDPSRIVDLYFQRNELRDRTEFKLRLRPAVIPGALREAVIRMANISTDEFRKDILAAAVPDLYKAQKAVLEQFDLLLNEQEINFSEDYIHTLLGHHDGISHNLGIRSPPFRDPRRRPDSDPVFDLSPIHPRGSKDPSRR